MSTLEITYRSQCLTRPVTFRLIWPNDIPEEWTRDNPCYRRPTKTLILLHGYTAGLTEWPDCSPIAQLAMKYNLAVACPDGGIRFYLDGKGSGAAWGEFVGRELPDYLRKNFDLADCRENTFIGGESMGGFGALHTALAWPETFDAAIALSSALIVRQVANMTPDAPIHATADYDYYVTTFGEPSRVLESDNNPETLVRRLKAEGKRLPRLFMACGTEDFLLDRNREFHDFLLSEEVPVSYHESPGAHNFEFWNQWIEPGLQWALDE